MRKLILSLLLLLNYSYGYTESNQPLEGKLRAINFFCTKDAFREKSTQYIQFIFEDLYNEVFIVSKDVESENCIRDVLDREKLSDSLEEASNEVGISKELIIGDYYYCKKPRSLSKRIFFWKAPALYQFKIGNDWSYKIAEQNEGEGLKNCGLKALKRNSQKL